MTSVKVNNPGGNSEKSPVDTLFYSTFPFQNDLGELLECCRMLIKVILDRRSQHIRKPPTCSRWLQSISHKCVVSATDALPRQSPVE